MYTLVCDVLLLTRAMLTQKVKRSSPRTFMHAPVEVKCSAIAGIHLGMMRDLSRDGIFFYSDFKPPVGSRLTVYVVLSEPRRKLTCRATVMRVEQIARGAAPGIAARLEQPTSALVSGA